MKSQQVACNSEIMVGSRFNSCGLLWYVCDYKGELLEDGESERVWTKEDILSIIEKHPIPDEWSVSFCDENRKRGYYNVKRNGSSFTVTTI